MIQFISGALVMAYAVASLFLLKFWSQTRERLFVFFAAAFVLLGVQRLFLALGVSEQTALILYAVRALAFLLIIAAIIDKNRPSR